LGLEKAEVEAAGAEVEVLEEAEDGGVGSDLEARLGLQRAVFAPIVEQLFLIGEDCLVFRQNVLIVVHP